MTINGITVAPDFIYNAGGGLVESDVWMPYKYGEHLNRVAVATPPTLNAGSPYLGRLDDSVKFNASDYYQAGNNTFADITTEDMVIETIFKFSGVAAERIIEKRNGNTPGWAVTNASATTAQLYLHSITPVGLGVITSTLIVDCWYHVIWFVDHSGFSSVYVDGVLANTQTSPGASYTNAEPLAIGARSTSGTDPYSSNIAWAAMWKSASGWFPSDAAGLAAQLVIARERANLVQGVHPHMARGTATPTVQTRASVAHTDKIERDGTRRIYLMGSGALRLAERIDANGKKLKGYLSEVQVTNLQTYSEDMTQGVWTKGNASITNTSTTALPNGDTSVSDVIHEDATVAAQHYAQAQACSFTNTNKYVCSFWVKSINRDWMTVTLNNNGTTITFSVDASDGTIGTATNITETGVEPWRNGWRRFWFSWTHNETTTRRITFFLSEANNDTVFGGLDQDSMYLWGVQVEAGVDYPTSYMPTGATEEIREEDSLRFNAADGNIGGTGSNQAGEMLGSILVPNIDNTAILSVFSLNVGGGASDRMLLNVATTDGPNFLVKVGNITQASLFGGTNITDGVIHTLRPLWQTDSVGLFADGALDVAEDTDCNIPTGLNRLDVGCDRSSVLQPNGLISDIEFFAWVVDDD